MGSRKYTEVFVETKVQQMETMGYVTSGVTMMKFFVDLYSQSKSSRASQNDKMISPTGGQYHLDVKMYGDEMFIDNSDVQQEGWQTYHQIQQGPGLENEMVYRHGGSTLQHETGTESHYERVRSYDSSRVGCDR